MVYSSAECGAMELAGQMQVRNIHRKVESLNNQIVHEIIYNSHFDIP
jgi:hypothetical protein